MKKKNAILHKKFQVNNGWIIVTKNTSEYKDHTDYFAHWEDEFTVTEPKKILTASDNEEVVFELVRRFSPTGTVIDLKIAYMIETPVIKQTEH